MNYCALFPSKLWLHPRRFRPLRLRQLDIVTNRYTNFDAVFGSGDTDPPGAPYDDSSTTCTGATKRPPHRASATTSAGPVTIKPGSCKAIAIPPTGPPDVAAADDGIFLESGEEKDYSVDDEVSDDDSIFLPGEDSESCLSTTSTSDLRLHTLKGWDVHMDDSSHDVQLSAAQLTQAQAVPSDTAEAIGLNLEGLFFMLPKALWVTIADASNDYQRWQRNVSPDQLAVWNQRRRARNPAFRPMSATQRQR
ncbi:hypothetical protein PHYSODRAFT_301132 [Phytophthora sojae]|uniref:Uncharacterized protein n=1 Tax=Phytophthora sojae (strain P6497) TaxID=1094619 RepID=G4ZF48_PHYSP|nr:hypothetical protein PHYSODRAFT_301132 [Phytophthora sojae]EGZ18479.1 hypothetical protein PHYSODRAFT_301132 [Phytophthora sojae]|eukprot:XP_009527537.1 hypothetical protein PHYSODRAFT_301132 [Phytophthora sojae]